MAAGAYGSSIVTDDVDVCVRFDRQALGRPKDLRTAVELEVIRSKKK
jgi:hypothetical protein